jgi:predicted nucleic acid-binding Zn ribbon protein
MGRANCSGCGKSCVRSSPQRGWTPPARHRCRDCRRAVQRLCVCGAPMDKESKRCNTCHRAHQRATSAGRVAGRKAWHTRSNAAAGLTRRRRRTLLAKWQKQNKRCLYCSGPCQTIDHVIPLTLGGTNYEGNLAPACWSCNSSKNNSLVSAWRYSLKIKAIATPLVHRPPAIVTVKAPPVRVVVNCGICGTWVDVPKRYCSDECRCESNARMARDRYRLRIGIPVDPCQPTNRWKSAIVSTFSGEMAGHP